MQIGIGYLLAKEVQTTGERRSTLESASPESGVLAAKVRVDVPVLLDDSAAAIRPSCFRDSRQRRIGSGSVSAQEVLPLSVGRRVVSPPMGVWISPRGHPRANLVDAQATLVAFGVAPRVNHGLLRVAIRL